MYGLVLLLKTIAALKLSPVVCCYVQWKWIETLKKYYGSFSLVKFISYLPHSFSGALWVWIKALSNDCGTELT